MEKDIGNEMGTGFLGREIRIPKSMPERNPFNVIPVPIIGESN